MDYKLPFPTLKHLTMVHVGTHVLNQRLVAGDQRSGIRNLPEEFSEWPLLKTNLTQIVDNLPLPHLLLSELWNVIVQLYFQIWDWMKCLDVIDQGYFYKSTIFNDFPIFCFDVHGELNQRKMMQKHIEKSFDFDECNDHEIVAYFASACYWCLEDCISNIWNQMNSVYRTKIFNCNRGDPVVMYWLDVMGVKDGLVEAIFCSRVCKRDYSTAENLIKYILYINENVSVEYFWHKLTDVEKARNAYDCAKIAALCRMKNLLCSTLTYLSKDQQLEFLAQYSHAVTSSFLLWPFDCFFFPTLELVCHTLSIREYYCLFEQIVCKMGIEYGGRFHHVLHEFWRRIPTQKKTQIFVGPESISQWLDLNENIKLIHPDRYEMLVRDIQALQGFSELFTLMAANWT